MEENFSLKCPKHKVGDLKPSLEGVLAGGEPLPSPHPALGTRSRTQPPPVHPQNLIIRGLSAAFGAGWHTLIIKTAL